MLVVAACTTGCGEAPKAEAPPAVVASTSDLPVGFDAPVPPVAAGAGPQVRLMLIPGCVMCERIDGMTKDLEKQYGANLRTDRHNSESPSGRAYLRSVGMRRHGVVIYDKAGQVAWRNDNHGLDRETLASALDAVSKGQAPTAEQRTSKWQKPDASPECHASPSPK